MTSMKQPGRRKAPARSTRPHLSIALDRGHWYYQGMDITKFEYLVRDFRAAHPAANTKQRLVAFMSTSDLRSLIKSIKNSGAGGLYETGNAETGWPASAPGYRGSFGGVHIFDSIPTTETRILAVEPPTSPEQPKLAECIEAAKVHQKAASKALEDLRQARAEQDAAPSPAELQARARVLLGSAIDLQLKNVTYCDPDAERAARLAIDLARAVGAV